MLHEGYEFIYLIDGHEIMANKNTPSHILKK